MTEIQTPFRTRGQYQVLPAWIDHNGHMNVGYYHVVFDLAAGEFFEHFGLDDAFRGSHQSSTFALESHLHFLREVKEGAPLRFEARLLDVDAKRIHFYQEMFHATEGFCAATYESISVHVDMRTRKTSPMPVSLNERLRALASAHAALPRPWQIGHVISVHPPAQSPGPTVGPTAGQTLQRHQGPAA
jgi:acyl-CoA thioester hydrolase